MKKSGKIISVLTAFAMSASMTGCAHGDETFVEVVVWNYYTSTILQKFEAMVAEFNQSVGRENNIVVVSESKGSVSNLAKAVEDSARKVPGSDELPDLFFAYADDAYSINTIKPLANLSPYFTQDELDEFVDGYLAEGYIDGKLMIFPVAKSTELTIVNLTEWNEFIEDTKLEYTLNDLTDMEMLAEIGEEYYKYSETKYKRARAFYARDALDNYVFTGMKQLGEDVYTVVDGVVHLNASDELSAASTRLWDSYAVPYINGYFSHLYRYGTDCIANNEAIVATCASTSAPYFPQRVIDQSTLSDYTNGQAEGDNNDGYKDIELAVIKAPVFDSNQIYTQQGAGIAAFDGDKKTLDASVEFIKWLASPNVNMKFAAETGYLPVRKDDNDVEKMLEYANDASESVKKALQVSLETVSGAQLMYSPQTAKYSDIVRSYFKNGVTGVADSFDDMLNAMRLDVVTNGKDASELASHTNLQRLMTEARTNMTALFRDSDRRFGNK